MSGAFRLSLVTIALVAIGLWMGGMVALGAIAAPVVFHTVPAPTSADAMTIVFRRFDKLAIVCVVLVLVVEAALARQGPLTKVDLGRAFLAVIAAGCAITVGLFVSPKIEALHRGGAIRGLGPDGLALESFHRTAERLGTLELVIALLLVALHVYSLARVSQTSHMVPKKLVDDDKTHG
jgi:Domain of unknown function (DUF4149)